MASAAKRRKAARKKKKELESQTTSNPHENGDLISENEKDSDGSTEINSPTSEDHPNSFNEGIEDLKSGESPSPPSVSINKPPESNAVVQIVKKVEAGVDLQIKQRDVEEAGGDETDGQGSELKSDGALMVKVVKKEETEEELESTSIHIERLESAKESYNGESESLPVVNLAENPPEVPMTLRVDLQIEQRDVEEAGGDETDGQGSELKSDGALIVKVVKKEETEEELESTSIHIERLESAKESYNGESESLPVVNLAENQPEVPMTLRVARRSSWMSCCGLLDVISGSRT